MTGLPAEGDMNIYAGHFGAKLHKVKQRILVLFLFVISADAYGQRNVEIYTEGHYENRQFKDTIELSNYLKNRQVSWVEEGYFFSGVDSIFRKEDGDLSVYLHKGKRYESEISKKKKIISSAKARLTYLVNNGYPFASVFYDSLSLKDDVLLQGKLGINQGPEIRLDSLKLLEKVGVNYAYLSDLLELRVGELFSEKDYQLIDSRIKRSSFLRLDRPKDIAFRKSKAQIFLDLSESKASQFEGVVGLQQDRSGGSTPVGSLRLDTDNLFRSGHQFKFLWERFSEESQSLDLHYKHAFLFRSSVSPSFRFELLKQDTSFLTRTAGLGFNVFIFSNIQLAANFESINASLISNDIEVLQGRALADYRRSFYRVELTQGHANSLTTLRQGLVWSASVGIGNKEIERNLSLPESYYDSINLNTEFVEITGMLAYQLNLSRRSTFFHRLNFGMLYNDELLTNELYRLGGLNSIRGFNEKEFFAKNYLSSRIELRSFFEQGSYLYVFYDQLFYKRDALTDSPIGLGLGFALETRSGQFNFALASGNSNQQSISFDELRAHFGYTATF